MRKSGPTASTEVPRIAIYARVSTDLQSPRSVPDQVALCQRWVDRQGWPPVPPKAVFSDEAVSGGTTHRTDYQRLLGEISSSNGRPPYDVIVVEDLSRLTREMFETTRLIQLAPLWNARIVGVSDAQDTAIPDSDISMAYRGIANAQYLKDLVRRIKRGLAGRFADSFHTGGTIYGYKSIPVPHASGRTDRFGNPLLLGHRLEPRPDQAAVVKRIFQEALAGMSCKEISRGLDRDNVPKTAARGKGHWDPAGVRSILTNERYHGLWRWQKMACVGKDPATGTKVMRPAEEVHEQQREDLRLVDDTTWNRVQERLMARAEGIKHDPEPGQLRGRERGCSPELVYGHLMNPLNGLLRCAVCGGPFSVIMSKAGTDGKTIRYMGCNTRHHPIDRCGNAGVFRLPDLEAALGEALEGYFSDTRLAVESMRWFQRTLVDFRKRLTADEQEAKGDLTEAEVEIGKVKKAILAGMIGETAAAMLRDAEQKQKAAQERLAAAELARLIEPQAVLPQEILAGLRAQDHKARREAYHRLLSEVRLRSERGTGRRMVKRWTAEIVARPEAAFKGLPKSLAFGKDFITVGRTPSAQDALPACGGD